MWQLYVKFFFFFLGGGMLFGGTHGRIFYQDHPFQILINVLPAIMKQFQDISKQDMKKEKIKERNH